MEEAGRAIPRKPCNNTAWSARESRVGSAIENSNKLTESGPALLYIHRRFFSAAIKINDEDPLQTKYGPSVMAVTRSACLIISSLRGLYGAHPDLAPKQPFFWYGAFSSIVSLCSI